MNLVSKAPACDLHNLLGGLGQTGTKLQKHRQVVAAHHSVTVGVHLQTPAETVDVERRGVDRRRRVLELREVGQQECAAIVARDDFTVITRIVRALFQDE